MNLRAGSWWLVPISILQWVSFLSNGVVNVNRHFSPGNLFHSLQSASSGGTLRWNPTERPDYSSHCFPHKLVSGFNSSGC